MWEPGIGPVEVILLAIVACLCWFSGKYGRRLTRGIVACFFVAMIVTPADPLSMLLVGMPLAIAFLCGALFAPQLHYNREDRRA